MQNIQRHWCWLERTLRPGRRPSMLNLGKLWSSSKLCTLVFLLLIAGVGLGVYVTYTQRFVYGWDPVAYLYAGERIAEGKGPTLCHPYNEVIGPYFTLAGFNVRLEQGPCLYSSYPPGFPLLLAAAQILTGLPDAAFYVPALLGVLGLVVTCALGAVLFDRWVGAAGALLMAVTPNYLLASTAPWSDLAGTVFMTGGMAFYIWGQSLAQAQKRRAAVAAAVGGGLVAYGFLIRYTSVVVLLPLALFILVSQKRNVLENKNHWLFGGVVVLGGAGILAFNRAYYGGYLTTGYSPLHGWYPWPAFSLRYALGPSPVNGKSLQAALQTLMENWGWLLILALIGLATMPRYKRLLVVGLITSFTLFYGLYAFAPQGVNARLLLPTFPALALAAAYGLRWGTLRWRENDKKRRMWALAGGAVLMMVLGLSLPNRLRMVQQRNEGAARHVQTVRALVESSEPDAVFLAYGWNDSIFYYGKRISLFYRRMPPLDPEARSFRWDQLESILVDVVAELLERGVPVYYVQDNDPPFADSLDILTRHFVLEPRPTTPVTFAVLAKR